MNKIAIHLLAATALLGFGAETMAADLGGGFRGPSVVQPLSDPAATSSGWYLRGDVGVDFGTKSKFKATEDSYVKTTTEDKVGTTGTIALGIGYQFNSYLRGDITGEMFGTRNTTGSVAFTGGSVANGLTANQNLYAGRLSSMLFLANAYVDLGKYSGLTPYVGAGVGAVHHSLSMSEGSHWDRLTNPLGTLAASGNDVGIFKGSDKWNFAWALHTGVSYDLASNLKLDVGYSYKDLGGIKENGGSVCANSYCPDDSFNLKRIAVHDVHVGARWMLDPVAKTPAYAPVVAKY
ncbi:porin family protein [Siculibacillus lacustris]|uniref:Porin family protein n=1 Tax=Siculibacillus lacustris TaxID=1549641 RepID=A0A4Q9VKK0_9HYPH|nr:outer membrane beta-barrel protein [Siculibacillus lacustris]TBW35948.1 porin family protein [Siculibacillus lacustris]